jgi:starvation-inducible outer membrane lipoprotein
MQFINTLLQVGNIFSNHQQQIHITPKSLTIAMNAVKYYMWEIEGKYIYVVPTEDEDIL